MSYTINPNAKNKWARNAENTMDLSLETDASSVYLDNGRTLEQELGEGSMVSNVATVDTSMSKVIDGTLDGAYESCVFKGKSLVNLMTSCKDETLIEYCNPPANSNVANVSMIKPNTVYTIIYSAKYQEEGNMGHLIVRTQQDGGDINVSSGFTFGTTYKRFAYKFTTPSTINYFVLRSNGHYFHVKEVMLLEGDYTNVDLPFFEGLCDVKMPILRNVGKNTFNIKNKGAWRSGWYSIPLELPFNGEVYVKCADSLPSDFRINLLAINRNEHVLTNEQIKKGHTAYYQNLTDIEFHCPSLSIEGNSRGILDDLVANGDIVIDVGGEPYKSNILRTSEEIILREVGGVCDTYNLLTGEYVRRIEEIVWDKTINASVNSSYSTESHLCFDIYNVPKGKIYDQSSAAGIITNSLIPRTWLSFYRSKNDEEGIVLNRDSGTTLLIKIAKSKLTSLNLEGLRTYLTQNPITVQYHLETPIVSTIEPLSIPFAYKNGHIVLESGFEGQSLLPTLECSTVINRTGQIQSIANTIQKQEKQITKLEQMLIQNIIDLDYNNTLLTLKNEMEEML